MLGQQSPLAAQACRAATWPPPPARCTHRQRQQRRRPRRRLAVPPAAASYPDGHPADLPLPAVNWARSPFLQQCLFIDRTDTVRARFAVGLLERIATWRGCSALVQGYACGLEAAPGSAIAWQQQAALFSLAAGWQVRPHLFTAARQAFEPEDVDRFELLICLDSGCQAEVLKRLSAARPAQAASYVQRIACLTDLLMYCDDEALLRAGPASLLDRQLRGQLALALPALRPSASRVAAAASAASAAAAAAEGSSGGSSLSSGEGLLLPSPPPVGAAGVPAYMLPSGIPRPPLGSSVDGGIASGSADEQWERMALLTTVCCAGLVQYLIDCRPSELDEDSDAD